jgi:hypothetical protein
MSVGAIYAVLTVWRCLEWRHRLWLIRQICHLYLICPLSLSSGLVPLLVRLQLKARKRFIICAPFSPILRHRPSCYQQLRVMRGTLHVDCLCPHYTRAEFEKQCFCWSPMWSPRSPHEATGEAGEVG